MNMGYPRLSEVMGIVTMGRQGAGSYRVPRCDANMEPDGLVHQSTMVDAQGASWPIIPRRDSVQETTAGSRIEGELWEFKETIAAASRRRLEAFRSNTAVPTS
jgi:hypothetical protein